jgi:hypothetical protein
VFCCCGQAVVSVTDFADTCEPPPLLSPTCTTTHKIFMYLPSQDADLFCFRPLCKLCRARQSSSRRRGAVLGGGGVGEMKRANRSPQPGHADAARSQQAIKTVWNAECPKRKRIIVQIQGRRRKVRCKMVERGVVGRARLDRVSCGRSVLVVLVRRLGPSLWYRSAVLWNRPLLILPFLNFVVLPFDNFGI